MALVLMRKAAIIDLGTNTFNLLIVELSESGSHILFKTKIPAKLGAGGFDAKTIVPESYKRGIAAILSYHNTILEHEVDHVYAFATSAMRDADNRLDFVNEAKELTGIEINIISGKREAELICKGVRLALDIGDRPELIIDIGGGSTEFIIADNKGVIWMHSYDLGVSRIYEYLKPEDPLTRSDIDKFEDHLNDKLKSLFEAIESCEVSGLIGSSGSFESLAEMIEKDSKHPNKLPGTTEYLFSLEDLEKLHEKLIRSTAKERATMKGLVEYRIETIPLASSFIQFILKKLSLKKVRLSTYALREGVISELSMD